MEHLKIPKSEVDNKNETTDSLIYNRLVQHVFEKYGDVEEIIYKILPIHSPTYYYIEFEVKEIMKEEKKNEAKSPLLELGEDLDKLEELERKKKVEGESFFELCEKIYNQIKDDPEFNLPDKKEEE